MNLNKEYFKYEDLDEKEFVGNNEYDELNEKDDSLLSVDPYIFDFVRI